VSKIDLCVAGAILLRRFHKISCSFHGKRIMLEIFVVILCGKRRTSDVSHCVLYTPHSTLYTPHSTLYTSHSTLYIPHSTLHTPHSTLYTPHFTLHALYLILYTPHSTLYTLYFTLHTSHFTLYKRCTSNSILFTPHWPFFHVYDVSLSTRFGIRTIIEHSGSWAASCFQTYYGGFHKWGYPQMDG